jgi:putative inorganic carbon (HCO3(-)) transporter
MELSQSKLNATTYFLTLMGVTLPLVSIALSQSFLALSILSFGWEQVRTRRFKLSFPPILWPLLLFMTATLIAWLWSPEPEIGRAPLNKFWLFTIIVLVTNVFDRQRSMQAYQLLFVLGVLAALQVIGQFLIVWRINLEARLTGFMGHWMTLSGGLMLASVASAGYFLFVMPRRRLLWLVGLAIMAASLALSLARSIWIATLVGVLVLLCMRHLNWRTFAAVGLALGTLLLLAPGAIQRRIQSIWDTNDPSNYARLAIWKAGVRMVKEHPWVGVGPQRVSKVFYDYHPHPEDSNRSGFYPVHMHNNLLQFAAERGIPCALFWLWLMLKVGWDHWRNFRAVGDGEKVIPAIGFTVVVAFFLAGLFEFNFGDSEVLMIFLFLVSAPYAVSSSAAETQPQAQPSGLTSS